jgi:hypothetical protein
VAQLGCALTERGNVQAGSDYQTTVPGVFACGDARRGQSRGHMQRRTLDPVRAVGLLVAILLLGCGLTVTQRAALDRFSAATSDFAAVGRSEFEHSRADVIEMNRRRLALGDDSVPANLDGPFTIDRTLPRLAALEALQEYAQLLAALVSTTPPGEIKAATDSFLASLRKVPGVSVSDMDASTIGRVVVLAGTFLVEYKRKRAIREVVERAHVPILATIERVKKDFDPASDLWNAGYRQVTLDLRGAALAARPLVTTGDLSGQALIKDATALAAENWARFTTVSAQVTQAADRLREAQENLHNAVRSNEISTADIDAYVGRVNELVAVYGLLRGR